MKKIIILIISILAFLNLIGEKDITCTNILLDIFSLLWFWMLSINFWEEIE